MAIHSIERFIHPQPIDYNPAIAVAVAGLIINLVCARLLHGHDEHDHHHHDQHTHAHHSHQQHHHHQDLNLRAAYLHVLTDALTSIFAIVALLGAKFYQLNWLDPMMGIVGSVLIVIWAYGLLKQSALALLDATIQPSVQQHVEKILAQLPASQQIDDFHLWRIGKNQYACMIAISADQSIHSQHIRQQLQQCPALVHINVDIHQHSNDQPRSNM